MGGIARASCNALGIPSTLIIVGEGVTCETQMWAGELNLILWGQGPEFPVGVGPLSMIGVEVTKGTSGANEGRVFIDRSSLSRAEGRYSVKWLDGGVEGGAFAVDRCETGPILCL